MNEEKRVILQGNEDYEIGNSQIAQLTLSDDKKTLIVKAVKAGEETIKIKDKKANKELPLHIAVLRPFSINPSTLNIKVGQTQSIAVEGGGRYQNKSKLFGRGSLSDRTSDYLQRENCR